MDAPKATALLVIAFAVEVAVTVVSDFAKRFSADGAIKHTCMHSLTRSLALRCVFRENEGGAAAVNLISQIRRMGGRTNGAAAD